MSSNTAALLRDCLLALRRDGGTAVAEIVVVDNASADGSVAMVRREFPDVTLIVNPTNVGFGAANNQGVRAATHQHVLLLNSDALVCPGAVDRLLRELGQQPEVGLVAPRLLNRDGSIHASAFRFPSPLVLFIEQFGLARFVPWVRHGLGHRKDPVRDVDWPVAACVLGRRDVLRRLGPFDPEFFTYSEDVDLCHRLGAAGRRVRYVPDAHAVRLGGGTTRQYSERMLVQFAASEYLFYRKHYGSALLTCAMLVFRLMALVKATGDASRLAAALVRRQGDVSREAGERLQLWWRVCRVQAPSPTSTEARGAKPLLGTPGNGDFGAQESLGGVAEAPDSPDTSSGRAITAPAIAGSSHEDVRGAPATETPAGPESRRDADAAGAPAAARGSLAMLGSFAVIAVLNYAFAISMGWLLPIEQFGRLGVMQSVLLLGATAVNAGFPWALTQAIARWPTALPGRYGAVGGAMTGNILVGSAIAAGLCGITVAGSASLDASYQPLMLLAGATVMVLAVLAVLSAALQGSLSLEELSVVRALEVLVKAAGGVLLVLALGAQRGAAAALGGFLVGALAALAAAVMYARALPGWWVAPGPPVPGGGLGRSGSAPAMRTRGATLFRSVPAFFVGVFCMTMFVNVDILGLKLLSPPDVSERLAGHYQAAVTLTRTPIFLVLALLNAVYPYAARHAPQSAPAHAYSHLALKYTCCFILPIDVALAVAAGPVVRTFFSPAFTDSALPLAVASAATVPLVLVHAMAMLLQAAGELRRTATYLAAAAVAQLAALAWLVPSLGASGAALSLAVAGVVALAPIAPRTLRVYDIRPTARGVAGYACALMLLGGLLWAGPHGSRVETLITFSAAGAAYLLALFGSGVLAPADVRVVSGGLGDRWSGPVERLSSWWPAQSRRTGG